MGRHNRTIVAAADGVVAHELDGQVVEGIAARRTNTIHGTGGDGSIRQRQRMCGSIELHRARDASACDV